VIGGGIGGTTVARYLALSTSTIDVTLVEPQHTYTTCFFGNLYLAGLRPFGSFVHSYEALSSRYGVTVVHESAESIDTTTRTVALRSGSQLAYDRLVVAPGIAHRPR
jgi:NADH dehydrogenase FAD-containing subunit